MKKDEIIHILEEIAILLELKGDNPFRIRAYRYAARTLEGTQEDLGKLIKEEKLTSLEGIGKDLAGKITTLHEKGRLDQYEKLKNAVPKGLLDMIEIPGLGAKKVATLNKKLGIKTITELKHACEKGKVAKLPGFGATTEKNILSGIGHFQEYTKRHLWWDAMEIATPILEGLLKLKEVKKAELAGSCRRKRETVGDLDFLVVSSKPEPIMDWFTSQDFVAKVTAKGTTKSSIRLTEGIQADLRVLPEKQYAFALFYFTGSKEHNIKIRHRAREHGLSLSEYGLKPINAKHQDPFKGRKKPITEKDLFKVFDLDYIPPELRENTGEIEAAEKGKLPNLIEEKDIRGAFHNHTTESDGKNTLEEMAEAAQKIGWDYIGIADHSKSSTQTNGLDEKRLSKQIEQIHKLNKSKKFKIHVFTGLECDILNDGRLDLSDDILKELDYIVVSIHRGFKQDEKTITKRLIRAIEHPLSTMVGHLTGRLLLRREPYAVNAQKVIDAAIANNKIIEINAQPQRLDMDWRLWHKAKEKGLITSINPDAHHIDHLQFFRAGVNIARKGWLEKKDVLNTYPLQKVKDYFC